MLAVTGLIVLSTLVVLLFALPKIDNSIRTLEEKMGKDALSKVTLIVQNVYRDLESFKQHSIARHKEDLHHLIDTTWSIIQAKYEHSKPRNMGKILKYRSDQFHLYLQEFYEQNQDKLSHDELKKAILNYINMYRYSHNRGYYFITQGTKVIANPVQPHLNGKNLKNLHDSDGVYFIQEFQKVCETNGSGIVRYKWENPQSKKVEDKITYVFKFEPFDWIIGTGEYASSLRQQMQNEVIELVNKLRYDESNYFFISNYDNVLLSHPYEQGKDWSDIKDDKDKLIIPSIIKIAQERGQGHYAYWSKKKSNDNSSSLKLGFVRDFPDWKMVIATDIYIDEIATEVERRKKELMKQLNHIIKRTTIGQTGYLYIFNAQGDILVHPNEQLNGTNAKTLKNPQNGTYIIDDLIHAAKHDKVLYYNWDRPDDQGNYIYPKVSWIEYIKELDWYVCSSAYVDEFKASSNEVKDFLFILSSILFAFSALAVYYFFHHLFRPINNLSKLALLVTSGDYSKRCHNANHDEIGVLSREFNKMVDTIEEHIEKLDLKVEQRTQELETIYHSLQDSIESASQIQQAIVPTQTLFSKHFDEYFIFWEQKEVVGGDIYLFEELRDEEESLLMVIDCTGHGVPGAFVTMLVKAIEREIVAKIIKSDYDVSPAIILQYFNKTMKKLLRQENITALSNSGFDGSVIYINKKEQIVRYAGAKAPLIYVQNGQINTIKGDKHSIGYKKSKSDYVFQDHTLSLDDDLLLYLVTDGYLDQRGGKRGFLMGQKRFIELIETIHHKPLKRQKVHFIDRLKSYQGDYIRLDDITLIGLNIKANKNIKN